MIKKFEKLIGDRGVISHHYIHDNPNTSHVYPLSRGFEVFQITFNDDLDSNESFWRIKIRECFSTRLCVINFFDNIHATIEINKSIQLDRKEKLNKLYSDD